MTLLSRHDPPAHLDDLARIAGGHAHWDRYISGLLGAEIKRLVDARPAPPGGRQARPQFFNLRQHDPGHALIAVPIVWNAFPKTLLTRFGRERAMVIADRLWPLWGGTEPALFEGFDPLSMGPPDGTVGWARPQNEYCEWRVERDTPNRIQRVVFTVEQPEYWAALFAGSPQVVVDLYRTLTGHTVSPADLALKGGRYNPCNRWNTSHGIVHCSHPSNTLQAEIRLCAESTLLFCRADRSLLTHPEALSCCIFEREPSRNSDPTVTGSVNALARAGALVTLANPIGVSISEVDTSGWQLPGGLSPRDCLHFARGAPGQAMRLVVQAPAGCGHTLDELLIAGVPLLYGGQIAECITVQAMAACTPPLGPPNPAQEPRVGGYLLAANLRQLETRFLRNGLGAGHVPAFDAWP